MVTQEVRTSLATVEHLIALLEQKHGTLDRDQLRVLRRLRGRRSALRRLLAARAAELPKQIIHLAVWRDGYMQPRKSAADAALSAAG